MLDKSVGYMSVDVGVSWVGCGSKTQPVRIQPADHCIEEVLSLISITDYKFCSSNDHLFSYTQQNRLNVAGQKLQR